MRLYYQTERYSTLLAQATTRLRVMVLLKLVFLDLNTGSEKNLPLSEDLFCIGLTHLSNGNALLAGGTKMYDTDAANCNGKWHGLNATYEVDSQSENLIRVSSMAHGRWHPTLVTLSDGKVVVANGHDEIGSFNKLIEVYDPASKSLDQKFRCHYQSDLLCWLRKRSYLRWSWFTLLWGLPGELLQRRSLSQDAFNAQWSCSNVWN